jgi:ADP-ribosyl-[dinitrogen reductase] hydrolase
MTIAAISRPSLKRFLQPSIPILRIRFSSISMSSGGPITLKTDPKTLDRIAGCLVGGAVADALGAPFEFGPPLPDDFKLSMRGGGAFGWRKGQFTDDSEMAVPIARLVASGADLNDSKSLDVLVASWAHWAASAKDVGMQTRSVLTNLKSPSEASARRAAELFHQTHQGRSAGNGSLMRTAPVALAFPEDTAGLIEATTRIAQLTHWEQDASEAAILWNLAIRTAYLHDKLDVREQLVMLPPESRSKWEKRIHESEALMPVDFYRSNGWVVSAFQAAWSAIHHTDNFVDAIEMAIRAGGDTDTVACIAGGLAGAFYGYSAIPDSWRHPLNGLDGVTSRELVELALSSPAAKFAGLGKEAWPNVTSMPAPKAKILTQHPLDDGLLLGNLAAINTEEAEEVIALCRIGSNQTTRPVHEFWLVDEPDANQNLMFTIRDCVATIRELRKEGKTVLLLCQGAFSRTPLIAAAYSVTHFQEKPEDALRGIRGVLPYACPLDEFVEALQTVAVKPRNSFAHN